MNAIVPQLNMGWLLAGMLAASYLAGHRSPFGQEYPPVASAFMGTAVIFLSIFLISFQIS